MNKNTTNYNAGILLPITLGLLSAFGPFITDFYLPALPEMTDYFNTSPSMVQMSLTTSVFGLAIGQLIIGPLSDKYGRKHLLLGSLLLFVIATICCLFSTDIFSFNTCRIFQGLGGAGGIVMSKSISTDMFTGKDLAKFLAILAGINGITPVAGPVIGGILLSFTDWRGIFWLVFLIGIALFFMSGFLKETLTKEHRMQGNIWHSYANLFKVLQNPTYTLAMLTQMCIFFAFFTFVSSSPFILQDAGIYNLSPFYYSLCFAVCTLAIPVGAWLFPRFSNPKHSLYTAAGLMLFCAIDLGIALTFHASVIIVVTLFTLLMIGFGMLQTQTTSIGMDAERMNAGSASAIMGAASFIMGGIVSPLVSIGNILHTTPMLLTFATLTICLLAWKLSKRVSVG